MVGNWVRVIWSGQGNAIHISMFWHQASCDIRIIGDTWICTTRYPSLSEWYRCHIMSIYYYYLFEQNIRERPCIRRCVARGRFDRCVHLFAIVQLSEHIIWFDPSHNVSMTNATCLYTLSCRPIVWSFYTNAIMHSCLSVYPFDSLHSRKQMIIVIRYYGQINV